MYKKTLAAVAAALLAGHASAALMSADTLVIHNFSNGYTAVDTSLTGTVGAGRLAGERTIDGVTSALLTYCTDLFQSFSWSTYYTDYVAVANGAPNGLTQLQSDLLGKLYTSHGVVASTLDSSAFQLAVWEIVNEADGALMSLGGGNFLVQSGAGAARALAESWLAAITAVDAPQHYTAQRLYSPSAQDFVWFAEWPRHPDGNPDDPGRIPEPASMALAGVALAGLAASRRRRPG